MSRDTRQGSLKKITVLHSTGARGRVSCAVNITNRKEIGHEELESDKIFRLRLRLLVYLTVRLRLLPKTSDSDRLRLRNPVFNSARELLGMTATSAPSERVFSHAGELYSAKRANLGVQTFAILMLMKMNSDLIFTELDFY